MKFTVADLIDQLPAQEQRSLSALEKALGLGSKADQEQLRIALTALVKVGVLEEADAGVSRVQDEGLIEARLRCSSKGFCFALREDGGEDIYIRDNQLNHAWNGDRVLVLINTRATAVTFNVPTALRETTWDDLVSPNYSETFGKSYKATTAISTHGTLVSIRIEIHHSEIGICIIF